MLINQALNNLFEWIEKRSAKKYYPVGLALILICISLFFAFPRYDLYQNVVSWDVTMLKSHDLTNNLSFIAPESFLAKKVFRLTVPVIIRLFHLNRVAVLVIQFILGFLFILFSYKLARRIFKDAVSATFFAAGIIFLYCGRTCFTEISYTWFDGWAYFFLLMTLYNRNFLAVFLFATLAAWTDERAFVALPIAILFHQVTTNRPNRFEFRGLISLNASSIGVIVAMASYIALRLFLTYRYNMHTPSELADFSVFKQNFIHAAFGFGAYTFLEGFWLLFPLAIFFALKNKHYILSLVMAGLVAVSSVAAFFVNDITRSGSYLFAILFVFMAYLSGLLESRSSRLILFICMFFAFIFPAINYVSFGDFEFRIEKPFFWVFYNLMSR